MSRPATLRRDFFRTELAKYAAIVKKAGVEPRSTEAFSPARLCLSAPCK